MSSQPLLAETNVSGCDDTLMDFLHAPKDRRYFESYIGDKDFTDAIKTDLNKYIRSKNDMELKDEYKVDITYLYASAASSMTSTSSQELIK
ncbi:MAG: hypothetical protein ACXACX_17765 [Candidatus Hodarchaeales archaeon]